MDQTSKDLLERLIIKNTRTFDWRSAAFDKQISFIEDPNRLKAAFTTRRGAKSYGDGIYLYKEAFETPKCNVLYLGLTRGSAKGIIWKDILKEINDKHKLGAIPHETDLTMTCPNASVIYVAGVDVDESERKKLFGRKYKLVIIDEAALYGIDLRDLVYVVLRPSLVDNSGTCVMSGMASDIIHGLFYDVTIGKEQGWSLHQWSAHDNPHVSKQWAEEIEWISKNQPQLMGTARFKQAYLNQWVVDEDKRVYKFTDEKNLYRDLPLSPDQAGWTWNLSIDTGWEDDNAFVVSGYHENYPELYIPKCWSKNKMTFDQVEEKVKEFMRDKSYPISSVIIDGANKQGVETMRLRSDIHFEYADKLGKADHIEVCNGDLLTGKIKVHESLVELHTEMKRLVWKTEGDRIIIPRKEHPTLPNHRCDAFLYGWFNGWHFLSTPAKKTAMPGTPEYIREQETLHKQAIMERMQRENAQKDNAHGWVKSQTGRDPWNDWN